MVTSITKFSGCCGAWSLAAYALFGVAAGLLLVLLPATYVVMLICGVICSVWVAKKPELGVLTIVLLIASLIKEDNLPLLSIGIGSFNVADLLLLFMFLLVLRKRFSNANSGIAILRSPLETPLMSFLLLTMLSALVSVCIYGHDFNTVARCFRATSFYLVFAIITNLITTRKQVTFLVTGLFAIAAAVALAMLIQTALGESVALLPESQIDQAGGLDGEEFNALRLRPPGQTLVLVSFVVALCFCVFQRRRSLLLSPYIYLVAILGAGVLLTFTRSYLVVILISVGLLFFLVQTEGRKRVLALVGGAAMIVLLLFAVPVGGTLGNTIDAVSQRYLTLLSGKELVQSSSLSDRQLENSYAIEQITAHPLLGIGLGNDYRPQIYGPQDEITNYVHNVYLWLLVDMGFPGFLLFMWFYLGFLARAIGNLKKTGDPFLKSVATGAMLVCIGLLPMGLTVPVFMEWHSIVVIATFMGLCEVAALGTKADPVNPETDPSRALCPPLGCQNEL